MVIYTPSHKKITIKPFLNTRTNPYHHKDRGSLYMLYLQITYNRKSTQIPYDLYNLDSIPKQESYFNEYEFENNFEKASEEKKLMVGRMYEFVEKLINYELERDGEERFSLVGFANRVEVYRKFVYIEYKRHYTDCFQLYLKDKLSLSELGVMQASFEDISDLKFLEDFKSKFDGIPNELVLKGVTKELVYRSYFQSTRQAAYPTYLDWILDESVKNVMRNVMTPIKMFVQDESVFDRYNTLPFEEDSEIYVNEINEFILSEIKNKLEK